MKNEKLIPETAKQLGHLVLAEGEATGHAHRVRGEKAALYDVGGTMVMDAPKGATITHEEHHEQVIPPGTYDRHIVREMDHPSEEAREVID